MDFDRKDIACVVCLSLLLILIAFLLVTLFRIKKYRKEVRVFVDEFSEDVNVACNTVRNSLGVEDMENNVRLIRSLRVDFDNLISRLDRRDEAQLNLLRSMTTSLNDVTRLLADFAKNDNQALVNEFTGEVDEERWNQMNRRTPLLNTVHEVERLREMVEYNHNRLCALSGKPVERQAPFEEVPLNEPQEARVTIRFKEVPYISDNEVSVRNNPSIPSKTMVFTDGVTRAGRTADQVMRVNGLLASMAESNHRQVHEEIQKVLLEDTVSQDAVLKNHQEVSRVLETQRINQLKAEERINNPRKK